MQADSWLMIGTIGLTALVTWLAAQSTERWRRGRGLLGAEARAERENIERLLRAKSDRAQGWRELWRAVVEFVIALTFAGLLGFFVGAAAGWWG